jgi:hypothetical protein
MTAFTPNVDVNGRASRPGIDVLRQMLQSGICAPSAENQLHLRFRVLRDSVQLLSTDVATWAERPHRKMLAWMSYGAVVENIALRSAALGWGLTVVWHAAPAAAESASEGRTNEITQEATQDTTQRITQRNPQHITQEPTAVTAEATADSTTQSTAADSPQVIADLRWTASPNAVPSPADAALAAAIEQRHTNRRFYRRAPLTADALHTLIDAAAAVDGAALQWLSAPARRTSALRAIRIAETERFRQRHLHDELFSTVRFELGWQRSTDDGLPPAALQVEPPMRPLFAALRHWPLMRALNALGVHHALGLRAGYLPCAFAPQLGLIVADAPNQPVSHALAGRAFQRVWLGAASLGLALQPMAAATVLTQQVAGNGWVSAAVQTQLQRLLAGLTDVPEANLLPCMLFRIGHAPPPSAVAGRRSLDTYLVRR